MALDTVVQNQALEPWIIYRKQQRFMEGLKGMRNLLFFTREMFRVVALLKQHLTDADMELLLFCLNFATPGQLFPVAVAMDDPSHGLVWGRHLPKFVSALRGFLSGTEPSYDGVTLLAPVVRDPNREMLLGPHCQCWARPTIRKKDPARQRIKLKGRRKQVLLYNNIIMPYRHEARIRGGRAILNLHFAEALHFFRIPFTYYYDKPWACCGRLAGVLQASSTCGRFAGVFRASCARGAPFQICCFT